MANYLLPELRPAQTDPIGSFARGFMIPSQVEKVYTENALMRAKIDEAKRVAAAKQAYAASGGTDQNALLQLDPIRAKAMEIKQQEALIAGMKPGLDLAYNVLPSVTEENYPTFRAKLVKDFPIMDHIAPQTYDPKLLMQFKADYERSRKLEDKTKVVGPDQALVGRNGLVYQGPQKQNWEPFTSYEDGQARTTVMDTRRGPGTATGVGGTKADISGRSTERLKNLEILARKNGEELTPENLDKYRNMLYPAKSGDSPEEKASRAEDQRLLRITGIASGNLRNNEAYMGEKDPAKRQAMLEDEVNKIDQMQRGLKQKKIKGNNTSMWAPGTIAPSGFKGAGKYTDPTTGKSFIAHNESEYLQAIQGIGQ